MVRSGNHVFSPKGITQQVAGGVGVTGGIPQTEEHLLSASWQRTGLACCGVNWSECYRHFHFLKLKRVNKDKK